MITIRLSRRERLIAQRCMGLDADEIDGHQAGALLVGEAPGPRSSPECPMFPYPPHSSGGRLLAISGMPALAYLQRFARADLLATYPGALGAWRKEERAASVARAADLLAAADGMQIVLLGRNVVEAFGSIATGVPLFGREARQPLLSGAVTIIRLPHPSGRSNGYSGRPERDKARELLRGAAGWTEDA